MQLVPRWTGHLSASEGLLAPKVTASAGLSLAPVAAHASVAAFSAGVVGRCSSGVYRLIAILTAKWNLHGERKFKQRALESGQAW